mmetsp:Transcript_15083/g.32696  ORF Transcript_15083/g.32696 Transcript_15083/m.32696 type:complete len:81 (+) Transcript_15083:1657-1899(+)
MIMVRVTSSLIGRQDNTSGPYMRYDIIRQDSTAGPMCWGYSLAGAQLPTQQACLQPARRGKSWRIASVACIESVADIPGA